MLRPSEPVFVCGATSASVYSDVSFSTPLLLPLFLFWGGLFLLSVSLVNHAFSVTRRTSKQMQDFWTELCLLGHRKIALVACSLHAILAIRVFVFHWQTGLRVSPRVSVKPHVMFCFSLFFLCPLPFPSVKTTMWSTHLTSLVVVYKSLSPHLVFFVKLKVPIYFRKCQGCSAWIFFPAFLLSFFLSLFICKSVIFGPVPYEMTSAVVFPGHLI